MLRSEAIATATPAGGSGRSAQASTLQPTSTPQPTSTDLTIESVIADADKTGEEVTQIVQSLTQSHLQMGMAFFQGAGVEQDYGTALSLFRTAANQGSAEAKFYLGYMYANGLGTTADKAQALTWYQEAVEAGIPEAQYGLGTLLLKDLGSVADRDQAIPWFTKAAEQNLPEAQYQLGLLYGLKASDPSDFDIQGRCNAYFWFSMASMNGYAAAIQLRDSFAGGCSEGEWATAQQQMLALITSKDYYGHTALYKAAANGKADAVESLLEAGAEVDATDNAGQTVLMIAANTGQKEAVEHLLNDGARVDARSDAGITALHVAANTDVAGLLLDRDADVNARDNEGLTPLDWAQKKGNSEVAALLQERGGQAATPTP